MMQHDDLAVIGEWMRARGDHRPPPDLLDGARARIIAEDAARRRTRGRVRAGMGLAAAVALVAVLATAVLPSADRPAIPATGSASAGPLLAVQEQAGTLFLVLSDANGDPLPDRGRIEIGHHHEMAQSPDGRTLAVARFPADDQSDGDLLLIDVPSWSATVAPIHVSPDLAAPAWTADSRTLVWFQPLRSAGPYAIRRDFQVMRWTVGDVAPVPGGVLDVELMPMESRVIGPDTLVVLTRSVDEEYLASDAPRLVRLDLRDGTIQDSLPLTGVVAGQGRHTGADGTGVYTDDSPAVLWDLPRDRLLVADADQLITVDLAAWTAERRPIVRRLGVLEAALAWLVPTASAKAPADGTHLQAVLSGDGSRLYLTGSTIDRTDGHPMRRPLGIRIVDTTDATVVATLDAPIDQVALSPDERWLVATGVTETFPADGEGISDLAPSDLLVLDAADLTEAARVAPAQHVTHQRLDGFRGDGRAAFVLVYRRDATGWLPTIEELDPASGTLTRARLPASTLDLVRLHR